MLRPLFQGVEVTQDLRNNQDMPLNMELLTLRHGSSTKRALYDLVRPLLLWSWQKAVIQGSENAQKPLYLYRCLHSFIFFDKEAIFTKK